MSGSDTEDIDKRVHRSGSHYPTPSAITHPQPGTVPGSQIVVGPAFSQAGPSQTVSGADRDLNLDRLFHVVEPGQDRNPNSPPGSGQNTPPLEGDNLDQGNFDQGNFDQGDNFDPGDNSGQESDNHNGAGSSGEDSEGEDHAAIAVIAMAQVSAAHKPPTFYGLSSEHPSEFLRQFETFAQIHGLHLTDGPDNAADRSTPTCYRFAACVSGDCARWLIGLNDATRLHYAPLRDAFRAKYCALANDWAENVTLKNIKQRKDEPVEIYLNRICEQVRRMDLNIDNCMGDIVGGLIPRIRREVAMQAPANVEDCIKKAKLAEVLTKATESENVDSPAVVPKVNMLESGDPMLERANLYELVDTCKEIQKVFKGVKSGCNSDNHDTVANLQEGQPGDNHGPPFSPQQGRPPQSQGGYNGFNANRSRGNYSNNWGRNNSTANRGGFNGRCFRCDRIGHRASSCRVKMNRGQGDNRRGGFYQQRGPQNRGNSFQNQGQPQPNYMYVPYPCPPVGYPSPYQGNNPQFQGQYQRGYMPTRAPQPSSGGAYNITEVPMNIPAITYPTSPSGSEIGSYGNQPNVGSLNY